MATSKPARVHQVINHASSSQMMVIANIGGRLCTKHIHKGQDGKWRYCSDQIPAVEKGEKPTLILDLIEV